MKETRRILVVDDDAVTLRATSRILKSAGYHVTEASTGAECLRLAREQSPDLVLLDVVLHEESGGQVCQRIKADPKLADVFVVLLSSVKTDTESQAQGLEAGADGYIARPIANRELVARVQALLRIKAAEDALCASEQKYRCLFENMTSGFVLLEACRDQGPSIIDFRYVEVNQATQKITGLAAEAMVGRTLTQVLGDKIHTPTVNLYKQVLTSGESANSEIYTPFLRKYVELYIFRAREDHIAVIYNDITERKRADDAVRVLSARYQATLAAVPDIIMEVDNNKVYTWANQAGLGFFGPGVIGKQAAFYFEGEQETYNIVQPLFNGNEDVIYVESWQRRQDGEKRLLGWWCRTLKDAQGNVTGALSTAHDITDRKRAQAALKEYSERLEQMVEERTRELRDAQEQLIRQERLTVLGQLAGGISHELRSPLGAIKNAIYLLNLAHLSPDAETAEILQILKQQIANAERSITSLMDFVRPEPPYRRATDIRETIDAALAQSAIPENVTVSRRYDEPLPVLSVDPDQLQIVFGNLIRNAIQAMPEGGQLTIDARLFDHQVSIAFRDTGIGIAPEILDKIFQPMFTTKSRGMGLGLALSKLLVEGHNGKISVTSQVGVGTTFTICLPMT